MLAIYLAAKNEPRKNIPSEIERSGCFLKFKDINMLGSSLSAQRGNAYSQVHGFVEKRTRSESAIAKSC